MATKNPKEQIMATQTKTKTAYERGYEDGAAAFYESQSIADPVNGWDGDLINAIGIQGFIKLFGLSQADYAKGTWSGFAKRTMAYYRAGCRDGCKAAYEATFREFKYETDTERGTIKAASILDAFRKLAPTPEEAACGAWCRVEDEANGDTLESEKPR